MHALIVPILAHALPVYSATSLSLNFYGIVGTNVIILLECQPQGGHSDIMQVNFKNKYLGLFFGHMLLWLVGSIFIIIFVRIFLCGDIQGDLLCCVL